MQRACQFSLLLLLVLAAPARSEAKCSTMGASWMSLGPAWILRNFPAHRTELTRDHRRQMSKISSIIADSLDRSDPIRCIRLVGHAATWRGISKDEYERRALVRAKTAAELLSDRLEMSGISPKIFARDELDDIEEFCEPVDGVDVTLIIEGRGDNCPLLPNLVKRTDAEARRNRAQNRRVSVYAVPISDPILPKIKKSNPCFEPGMYCVDRHHYMNEGRACSFKGHWWGDDLEAEVERGEATFVCDTR